MKHEPQVRLNASCRFLSFATATIKLMRVFIVSTYIGSTPRPIKASITCCLFCYPVNFCFWTSVIKGTRCMNNISTVDLSSPSSFMSDGTNVSFFVFLPGMTLLVHCLLYHKISHCLTFITYITFIVYL